MLIFGQFCVVPLALGHQKNVYKNYLLSGSFGVESASYKFTDKVRAHS